MQKRTTCHTLARSSKMNHHPSETKRQLDYLKWDIFDCSSKTWTWPFISDFHIFIKLNNWLGVLQNKWIAAGTTH